MYNDEIAEKKWMSLPSSTRKKLEENVFCGNCGGATTIVDYQVESVDYQIILKGRCKKCDGKVARVID